MIYFAVAFSCWELYLWKRKYDSTEQHNVHQTWNKSCAPNIPLCFHSVFILLRAMKKYHLLFFSVIGPTECASCQMQNVCIGGGKETFGTIKLEHVDYTRANQAYNDSTQCASNYYHATFKSTRLYSWKRYFGIIQFCTRAILWSSKNKLKWSSETFTWCNSTRKEIADEDDFVFSQKRDQHLGVNCSPTASIFPHFKHFFSLLSEGLLTISFCAFYLFFIQL